MDCPAAKCVGGVFRIRAGRIQAKSKTSLRLPTNDSRSQSYSANSSNRFAAISDWIDPFGSFPNHKHFRTNLRVLSRDHCIAHFSNCQEGVPPRTRIIGFFGKIRISLPKNDENSRKRSVRKVGCRPLGGTSGRNSQLK